MSFIMKVFASLDIVSFAFGFCALILSYTSTEIEQEVLYDKICKIASFVFFGSLVGTFLTWIWGW